MAEDLEQDDKPVKGDVDSFIRVALKRFRIAADAETELRAQMLEDKRFMASDQWDPSIKREREAALLPCLTINKLKQPRRQILHGQSQGRPAIQINPVDSVTDPKKAEALQGLVRNIERQSQSDVVYETAGQDQVDCGRGYFRILTEYEAEDLKDTDDPLTIFQQRIRLKRVRNPFTIYVDPSCQEVDYRDARYYFVIEDVPHDEYRERYPDSQCASADGLAGIGNDLIEWANEKTIRIAEYFYVETVAAKKCMLEVPGVDGGPPTRVVITKTRGFKVADGVKVLGERDVLMRQVKWATINAVEVLDGNDDLTAGRNWPGKYIPIVPVLGDEIDINGKVDLRGMVRDARDSMRVYNYQVSFLLETMGLASKSPWIVAEGQIEDAYKGQWETANTVRHPYLTYKPLALGGGLAPPPQRGTFEPAIQSTVVGIRQAEADIMSVTGFHEPSLGEQGPQESGRAIMARQRQGEIGSSNYMNGLSRAIRFGGEILIDLIPKIIDQPRAERILGSDDVERTVVLHSGAPEDSLAAFAEMEGLAGIYDISTGRYDVTVSVGKSFESRRQESSEMMTQVIQANPEVAPHMLDLLFKNMDTPGSLELSERFKKLLDPRLQDEGANGQPNAQQLQGQLQQMQMQLEQIGQAYQQAQQIIETKAQELAAKGQQVQMELQSKERTTAATLEAKLREAEIKAQTELLVAQQQINAEKALAGIKGAIEAMLLRLESGLATQRMERETVIDVGRERERTAIEAHREDKRTAHDDEREDQRFEREQKMAENGDGASA